MGNNAGRKIKTGLQNVGLQLIKKPVTSRLGFYNMNIKALNKR